MVKHDPHPHHPIPGPDPIRQIHLPGTRRFFPIGTSALVAFILIFAWGVVRSAN